MEQIPVLPRISDYVYFFADRSPNAEAMVFGEQRTTYRSLSKQVDACARALMACGVGKGDRVAVLSTPRPEAWITFLATARIGAIWTGLNPRYTRDEMAYVIGDCAPKLLIALERHLDRDFLPDARALKQTFESIETLVVFGEAIAGHADDDVLSFDTFLTSGKTLAEKDYRTVVDAVEPRDPALIVYTSGSTGKPKGALVHHYGPSYCSHFQNRYWGAQPGRTRLINFFPVNHLACVVDISCFALVWGGALVFMEQFDPAETLRVIECEKITVLGGVPTMLQLIFAEADLDSHDLSSLETIAFAGAAAPEALVHKMKAYAPLVSTGYGMTETIGHVTFSEANASAEQIANSIGRPVPDYDIRIAAADGHPVPPGEEGEIQVRGDFIFLGYFKRPEATAETFTADGWLRTGDVAIERPDGYWKMVGRMKEMYKSGGYNVYPREIEICLESHPDIEMAAVVGVPDELYQEVGHAYCLVRPGAGASVEALRAFCREHLANYKIPKVFSIRDTLPMLPVGKVDKQALKRDAMAVSA